MKISFLRPDGTLDREVEATAGDTLLSVAQAAGQPLEGTCEGAMACSTCHVILDPDDFERLPPAGPHEEDMLDFAPHARRTSRLACQIMLTEALGTLTARMPPGHSDLS